MNASETSVLPHTEEQQYYESQNDLHVTQRERHEFAPERCCRDVQYARNVLCEVVHSHNFQVAVIILVLLDCVIVVTEIMLETSKRKTHTIKEAEHVLHYCSLTILSIFVVEVSVKMFAMGFEFFKHKWEVFDAVVVFVSFFLDIFLSRGDNALADGVEFLVLLRLWRITRIVNGIVVSVKTRAEEKMEKIREEKHELNDQITRLEMKVEAQKREIVYLKGYLRNEGVNVDELKPPGEDFEIVYEH